MLSEFLRVEASPDELTDNLLSAHRGGGEGELLVIGSEMKETNLCGADPVGIEAGLDMVGDDTLFGVNRVMAKVGSITLVRGRNLLSPLLG